jgi:hypothetical protein
LTSGWQGRSSPAAAKEKAAPWPPDQPERPGIDFSYSIATVPTTLTLYFSKEASDTR